MKSWVVILLGLGAAFSVLAQTDATVSAAKPPSGAVNPDHPRVRLETELGDIEVELDAQHAPITASNFLRYVDAGLYNGASFFRTVTLANQPTNAVKIQVVQAEANTARRREYFPAIPLERTRDTGLHHRNGTLSMARSEPDSARDSFSICVGDQPGLDFGGGRNPDGQGFAAFGQVVAGMEVVLKIQASPADVQQLKPRIRIKSATRIIKGVSP